MDKIFCLYIAIGFPILYLNNLAHKLPIVSRSLPNSNTLSYLKLLKHVILPKTEYNKDYM